LFVGIAFLLPAGVLVLLFDLPFPALSSIGVVVTFAVWWALKRWGEVEFWRTA